jgi:hypothetical protein
MFPNGKLKGPLHEEFSPNFLRTVAAGLEVHTQSTHTPLSHTMTSYTRVVATPKIMKIRS